MSHRRPRAAGNRGRASPIGASQTPGPVVPPPVVNVTEEDGTTAVTEEDGTTPVTDG